MVGADAVYAFPCSNVTACPWGANVITVLMENYGPSGFRLPKTNITQQVVGVFPGEEYPELALAFETPWVGGVTATFQFRFGTGIYHEGVPGYRAIGRHTIYPTRAYVSFDGGLKVK